MIEVREATARDLAEVSRLHARAFGEPHGHEIGELVTALHDDSTARPLWSLVAVEDGCLVGHVLFTHARLDGDGGPVRLSLLGPLGVIPEAQRRGVGTALVQTGLQRLRDAGIELVLVLGVPSYYPQHGFEPATPHGLRAPFHDPVAQGEAWMVHELRPGWLGRVTGQVCCAAMFNEERHWRE